jgi:hypothetical protein
MHTIVHTGWWGSCRLVTPPCRLCKLILQFLELHEGVSIATRQTIERIERKA